MSKHVLLIDPEEALRQFIPAIWGGSDLNENQVKRLAKKLVTLLEQNCKVDGVEFKAKAQKPVPIQSPQRLEVYCDNIFTGLELPLDKFEWGDPVQVFVVKKENK